MGTAARRKKVTAAAAPLVIDESHLRLPWSIKDATVSEITCVGWLERIPGVDRPRFMDEAWRVLVPSGVMRISMPSCRVPSSRVT